ncbi:MAG: DUF305 domain-containing protein [Actinobacteria bacterium]|jgi:uncharacterized protein (DUF305 family)|nr:DUF305 domain-containing protein [Actinomycetota bacterium]
MKKVILLFLALLITGCASESNSGYSSQDIMFAEMMIPHHQQAIEMSDLALKNSTNPEVLALAQQIKDAQSPEIEQMKSWGASSMAHMGHMMDGMLSDEEMSDLAAATGSRFDKLFLEGMIKHHEGAIDMVEMVIDSKNSEVAALAKAIIEAQRKEISKMKELLSALGNG